MCNVKKCVLYHLEVMNPSFISISTTQKMRKPHRGKITVKGTTQMSGHSLKLHFVCLKDKKGSIIVWIIIIFLQYFPLIAKVTCSNLDITKECFYMFKTLKPRKDIHFFQMSFFLPNVHHSLWKLERILTLMIIKAKRFELMKIIFIIHLNTFGSKVLLTLKIMDFENVAFIKVVHIYVIEGMDA